MTDLTSYTHRIYIHEPKSLMEALPWLKRAKVMGIDTETTGLNPHNHRLRLIQIATFSHPTVVLDCFKLLPKYHDMIQSILSTGSMKVFQNARFDLSFLRSEGLTVEGNIFDTMLAAQLLRTSGGPQRVGLASLCEHYLALSLPKEEQVSDFSGALREAQLDYAARDAAVLLDLYEIMRTELGEHRLMEVARLEFACTQAIAQMEYTGIHLDLERWAALGTTLEDKRDAALESLYPYVGYPSVQMGMFEDKVAEGFNPDSHKQLLAILHRQGIKVQDTSRHSLAGHMDQPIVQAIMDYRHCAKALSSFIHPIPKQVHPKTGRLHPRYGQIGAHSGRMSCGGPNIQQIPRDAAFRQCFTAPKGRKLVIADYSQIELRVIAEISGDERMIRAYREGQDLHRLTASLILGKPFDAISKEERQAAKAVNFGLVFGMGAAGLQSYSAETYGVTMTMKQAEVFKARFFKGYQGLARWHQRIKLERALESRTLAGRKHTYRMQSGLAGRYNTPVQGTAADIVKNAMGMLYHALKDFDAAMVAVVHDEIVLECCENQAQEVAKVLKQTMEQAGSMYLRSIPVIADAHIAESWAEK